MLCLNLLQYRLGAEQMYQDAQSPEERESASDSVADIQDHLMDTGLWDAVVPSERPLFTAPIGSWSDEQMAHAAWRREALGVLMWALNLLPTIPAYDTPFEDLGSIVDPQQWLFIIEESFLQTDEDVDLAHRTAEVYHWRTTVGKPPYTETNNPELIARTAQEYAEFGLIPEPVQHDFPAFGVAFHMLDDERAALVRAIASERHFAFEWLLGHAPWV